MREVHEIRVRLSALMRDMSRDERLRYYADRARPLRELLQARLRARSESVGPA